MCLKYTAWKANACGKAEISQLENTLNVTKQ